MDGVSGGGKKVSYGERVPITLNVNNPRDLEEVSFQVFSDSGPPGRLIDVTYNRVTLVVPSSGQGSMYVLAHVRLRSRSDVCYFRSGHITFPDSGSVTPTEPESGAHGTADADAGSWGAGGLRVRNAVGSILGGLPGNAVAYVANQTVKVVANGCRGVHSENDRKLLGIGCVLAGAAGWRHTSVPRRESLNPG